MSHQTPEDPWAAVKSRRRYVESIDGRPCKTDLCAEVDSALTAERAAAATREQALQAKCQLLDDIRDERADDYSHEAVEACEDCGPLVMCPYHSVLSALFGGTWTQPAIDRANQRTTLQAKDEEIARLRALNDTVLEQHDGQIAVIQRLQERVAAAREEGLREGLRQADEREREAFMAGVRDTNHMTLFGPPKLEMAFAAYLASRSQEVKP